MTARLVLICDVCGAVTDDHYAHPVADARFRARATGWTRRRHIRKNGDRLYVDLCPEHTYDLGFLTEPVVAPDWKRPRPNPVRGEHGDPQPLSPRTTTVKRRFENVRVVYKPGDGPYRLYTALVRQLRDAGAARGTTERIRREMFAAGVDFLDVARRWANVETEDRDDQMQGQEGVEGGPCGRRSTEPGEGGSPPSRREGPSRPGPVEAGPDDPGAGS